MLHRRVIFTSRLFVFLLLLFYFDFCFELMFEWFSMSVDIFLVHFCRPNMALLYFICDLLHWHDTVGTVTAREPTFMWLWASNFPRIKVNPIVITCFHDIQSWHLYPVPAENLVLDPGNIRPIDIYDQTWSETLAIIQFKVLGENLFINILEVKFS